MRMGEVPLKDLPVWSSTKVAELLLPCLVGSAVDFNLV